MIGFKFLVVGQGQKPINHGTIVEKVTEGKYLCQFVRIPTSCRVVDIDEIQGWNLFPGEDAMNEFIAALDKSTEPPPPPADPPADPPKTNGSKANAKKSKAKKKAKSTAKK